jgi:hypothetical protein
VVIPLKTPHLFLLAKFAFFQGDFFNFFNLISIEVQQNQKNFPNIKPISQKAVLK